MKKDLQSFAKSMGNSLPFMLGREKGTLDDLIKLDKTVTIVDFGNLKDVTEDGEENEYVCFIIKEDKKKFFFGGMVLTKNLNEMKDEGYYEEIVKNGLPVKFTARKSKSKRPYTACQFYPE